MAQEHSKQIGKRPLILAADYFTEVEDGKLWEGTRITMTLARDFDFDKQGAALLRQIKSAMTLFHNEVPE